jgi:hypothetical protein
MITRIKNILLVFFLLLNCQFSNAEEVVLQCAANRYAGKSRLYPDGINEKLNFGLVFNTTTEDFSGGPFPLNGAVKYYQNNDQTDISVTYKFKKKSWDASFHYMLSRVTGDIKIIATFYDELHCTPPKNKNEVNTGCIELIEGFCIKSKKMF